MNLVDVAIVGAVLVAAATGGRLGLVTRLLSWVWMVVGVVAVVRALPWVFTRLPDLDPNLATLVTLGAFAGALGAGNAVGAAIGSRLSLGRRSGRAAAVNRVGGALVGGAGALTVVWLLLPVVAGLSGSVAAAVNQSGVARFIDARFPEPPDAVQAIRRFTSDVPFPQVFDQLQATPDPGPPPEATGIDDAVSEAVVASTLRVVAPACGRIQSGTSFVAGETTGGQSVVVTNAHVVAGSSDVRIVDGSGVESAATVVGFDPVADLAVLVTRPLGLPPLRLDNRAKVGASAVFGFPGGGPMRIAPACVIRELGATGRDIYGSSGARRDVLELAAQLEPGDSGAPLVDPGGAVAGVVFAVATDRSDVAYALTAAQSQLLLDQAASGRWLEVSSGPCLN